MKLRIALPSVVLAVAAAFPLAAGTAGALATTEVTIVDGFQYDAENLIELTVCFDDTLVQRGAAVINPSITSTPGTHTLSVSQDEASCGSDTTDWITSEVTLLDVTSQAMAFGWPTFHDDQTRTLPTWVFADDLSCTPADQGRITFRNINSADVDANFGKSVGDDRTALFSDVAVGDQASALVAAPTYPTTGEAVGWETGNAMYPLVSTVTGFATAPGTVNVIYAYGGNDGDIGLTNVVLPASVCGAPPVEPVPTTQPKPAVPAAPAAVAVSVQPTYTG